MDEIDKRMKDRFNLFNENSINYNKQEKEINRVNLRKKKVQNIMMRKRYYDNYSFIYSNNNNINSSKRRINIIDISSFLINDDLKRKETVQKIISENSFKTIFDYINEIYKEDKFQIDILKYGLFLLNEKLLKLINERDEDEIKSEEDDSKIEYFNNKIINELIDNNIKDIINKLLTFSYSEIKSKDNETIILTLAYQILVNFTYLSNEVQINFLIEEKSLKLHLYFLRYSSEEHNIINILRMFYNIFVIYKSTQLNNIFTFNKNELLNLLNEYISSGINSKNYIIIDKILDIYSEYLSKISNELDDNISLNITIIEEIYELTLQSIFCNSKSIFSNSLYIIGMIYKISFKSNKIELLSKFILSNYTKKAIELLLDYNYIDSPENITDFCRVIYYIIKCESNCNDLNTKKQLESFIKEINNGNMNDYEIIFIVVTLIQKNYTNRIISKLINVLIALCESETFY